MMDSGLLAAFLAGALSISSPCVLPLLPLYLAHLAGVGVAGEFLSRRIVLIHALAFVTGFGVVFVLLGISLGALGGVFIIYRDWIIRIAGAYMILTGLHLTGLIRLPVLDREYRLSIPGTGKQTGRLSSSLLIGVGFADGWTPCVGPILGGIFTLAVGAAEPMRAGTPFATYVVGLAVPFLIAAAALGRFDRRLHRISAGLNTGSGGRHGRRTSELSLTRSSCNSLIGIMEMILHSRTTRPKQLTARPLAQRKDRYSLVWLGLLIAMFVVAVVVVAVIFNIHRRDPRDAALEAPSVAAPTITPLADNAEPASAFIPDAVSLSLTVISAGADHGVTHVQFGRDLLDVTPPSVQESSVDLLVFEVPNNQATLTDKIDPKRDGTRPAAAVTEWSLPSEPRIFLIDGQGTTAERFEGRKSLTESEPSRQNFASQLVSESDEQVKTTKGTRYATV